MSRAAEDERPSLDPESSAERPGIFGVETEYVVFFVSDDPDAAKPPFAEIEKAVWHALSSMRKVVPSSGVKRGYFLENGGLIHFEVFLREQGDTPVLEASTPECRSPRDVLVWSRAFDHLLEEISKRASKKLVESGWAGYIAFGKNNRDSRGAGFGSHENYLVYHRMPIHHRVLALAALPIVGLLLLPAFAVFFVYYLGILGLFFGALLAGLIFVILPIRPLVPKFLRRFVAALVDRDRFWRNVSAGFFILANVLLVPATILYKRVLRVVAYPQLIAGLTPFLATRQIWAGTGSLDFRRGIFELSQRSAFLATLSEIVIFGKRRTAFDLKGFLYRPCALFSDEKRLVITAGDSNLSDIPFYLKIGATALIIEMIEEGERFDDLDLAHPMRAFRQVSRGGPYKELTLARGGTITAIEIQRRCLERAEAFFRERADGRMRAREILLFWRRTLECFEEDPAALASALDWAAKKSILDRLILERSTWSKFFAWGGLFERAGLETAASSPSLAALARRLGLGSVADLERTLRNQGLDPEEFSDQRELWLRAKKIDLRYHELNPLGGYQRILEASGVIERLTVDEDVERASREPPSDTRARVRGYYVRAAPAGHSIRANWHEITDSSYRRIPLEDPFAFRIPGEDRLPPRPLGSVDPEAA